MSASLARTLGKVAREAAWAPIAVLILHEVAGRIWGHEPHVDPVMHFLGGLAAAFFFRHAASTAGTLLGRPTPLALDLLAFGLTCAVALFWEFGEFASDRLLRTTVQRGLQNTMRDLMLGVSGGFLYLAARRFMPRSTPRL